MKSYGGRAKMESGTLVSHKGLIFVECRDLMGLLMMIPKGWNISFIWWKGYIRGPLLWGFFHLEVLNIPLGGQNPYRHVG